MRPRTVALVAVSGFLLLGLVGCSKATPAPSTAATVGATQITNDQVALEAKLLTFLGALQQQQCGDTTTGVSVEVACNRIALSTLIQGSLIDGYATEHGIAADPNDVATLVSSLDGSAGKDQVDRGLAAQGLTRDDLTGLAREVQIGRLVQHALGEADLGDAKLRQLYQQQILAFTNVAVEQILVKTKAEADQVYQQVTQPGATEDDFKALARQVSTDPSVKQNSGVYPLAPASNYVTSFANAAAALEPGQISKPVKSQFGWHVIRLVDKQVTPFEEAKARITLPTSETTAFDDWLRQEAKDQGVDVNPRYGTFDGTTLSVVAVNTTDTSATASPSAPASASP
jgi:peptidyl-prolyl cis-trans isomerase C